MANELINKFNSPEFIVKIENKLPKLFQIAELECARAGKIGMEVGSVRERILISILISEFGSTNVETEIPITKAEIDVELFGNGISIKTITGANFSGVKLIWTVDSAKALEFAKNYYPNHDILLVQIKWGGTGGLYYIPALVQQRVFQKLGKGKYFKLPKKGTNPRGVEITKEALIALVSDKETKCININWNKAKIDFDPHARWIKYWE
ncbi:MAG: ThaI family type II restriction endonuclease [Candidatus Omnitrophota bacterium]